jgi:hypothetical protein
VPADDVPPELDRAVMAQATSAVRAITPKLQTWRRYSMPVTLAATVVVAVSIVLNVQQNEAPIGAESSKLVATPAPAEIDLAESEASMQPAVVAPSESREAPQPERREKRALEDVRQTEAKSKAEFAADIERRTDSVQSPPPSPVIQEQAQAAEVAAADAAAPAMKMASTPAAEVQSPPAARTRQTSATTQDLEQIIVTAQQRPAQNAAGPRSNVPSGQTFGLSERERVAEREARPELWLKYIRDLRAVNRNVEANREWQRFLKAYPNHPVAVTDSARPKMPPP